MTFFLRLSAKPVNRFFLLFYSQIDLILTRWNFYDSGKSSDIIVLSYEDF